MTASLNAKPCIAEPNKCFARVRSAFVEPLVILAILVANGSARSASSWCYLCRARLSHQNGDHGTTRVLCVQ